MTEGGGGAGLAHPDAIKLKKATMLHAVVLFRPTIRCV